MNLDADMFSRNKSQFAKPPNRKSQTLTNHLNKTFKTKDKKKEIEENAKVEKPYFLKTLTLWSLTEENRATFPKSQNANGFCMKPEIQ
jgi:hypothetical protein